MSITTVRRTVAALVLTISITVAGLTISNAAAHPAKAPVPADVTSGGGGRLLAQ